MCHWCRHVAFLASGLLSCGLHYRVLCLKDVFEACGCENDPVCTIVCAMGKIGVTLAGDDYRTEAVEGFIQAKACCRVSAGPVVKAEPRFQDSHMAVISTMGDSQVKGSM